MKNKLSIIGGDIRYYYLACLYKIEGNYVTTYGHENHRINGFTDIPFEEMMHKSNIYIAPIPFSKGDNNIYCPLTDNKIDIEHFITQIKQGSYVISGLMKEDIAEKIENKGAKYLNLCKDEVFMKENAALTAQGTYALLKEKINMENIMRNCLVIGYGRCGRQIVKLLKNKGHEIYIKDNKRNAESKGCSDGFKSITDNLLGNIDVIINTAPYQGLDRDLLKRIKKQTVIIDIASAKYGCDYASAEELNLIIHYEAGIPGRIVPLEAAKVLKKAIDQIILRRGKICC